MLINQQLIYFQKTADYSSITRAAESLFVDASTVSKSINNLEEKLGVPLFAKEGRNIKLTGYGKMFYSYVESGMGTLEKGVEEMQNLSSETRGHVHLSTIYSVASYYLPLLLDKFQKEYPEITIDLAQRPSGNVVESVSEGTSDLGICGSFDYQQEYPNLSGVRLFSENVELIVSLDHPLAEKNTVTFEDIKDEKFIGYTRNTSITNKIQQAIQTVAPRNYKPTISYTCNEDNTAASLIRQNLGIGFICIVPTVNMEGLKIVKLEDVIINRNVDLVWNHDLLLTKATQTFQKFTLSQKNFGDETIRK